MANEYSVDLVNADSVVDKLIQMKQKGNSVSLSDKELGEVRKQIANFIRTTFQDTIKQIEKEGAKKIKDTVSLGEFKAIFSYDVNNKNNLALAFEEAGKKVAAFKGDLKELENTISNFTGNKKNVSQISPLQNVITQLTSGDVEHKVNNTGLKNELKNRREELKKLIEEHRRELEEIINGVWGISSEEITDSRMYEKFQLLTDMMATLEEEMVDRLEKAKKHKANIDKIQSELSKNNILPEKAIRSLRNEVVDAKKYGIEESWVTKTIGSGVTIKEGEDGKNTYIDNATPQLIARFNKAHEQANKEYEEEIAITQNTINTINKLRGQLNEETSSLQDLNDATKQLAKASGYNAVELQTSNYWNDATRDLYDVVFGADNYKKYGEYIKNLINETKTVNDLIAEYNQITTGQKIKFTVLEDFLLNPFVEGIKQSGSTYQDAQGQTQEMLSFFSGYRDTLDVVLDQIKLTENEYNQVVSAIKSEGLTPERQELLNSLTEKISGMTQIAEFFSQRDTAVVKKYLTSSKAKSDEDTKGYIVENLQSTEDEVKMVMQRIRDTYATIENITNIVVPKPLENIKPSLNVGAYIHELFEGLASENAEVSDSSFDKLMETFKLLNEDLAKIPATDVKKNLENLINIRNIWSKMLSIGEGSLISGVNVAGFDFKNIDDLYLLIKAIKDGYSITRDFLEDLSKPNKSIDNKPQSAIEQVAQQQEKDAEKIKKSSEKVVKEIKESSKKIKDALAEKHEGSIYKDSTLQQLQNSANNFYPSITSYETGKNKNKSIGYKYDHNLFDIKEELQYRINTAKQITEEYVQSLKLLQEIINKTHSETLKLNIGGQDITNPAQLSAAIGMLEQMKSSGATQTNAQQTNVGQVAEVITKDTQKLEQANQKAGQTVERASQIQEQAKNISRGGGSSTPPNTPPDNGGNNGGVRVDYVTANDNLDISSLIAKIQEKLDEHPFTINNVVGAPNVQITNVKEQIEKSVDTSTDTVNKSIDNLQKKLTALDDTKFEKLNKSFEGVIKQVDGFKDKLTELKTDIQSATNDKSYGMPKVNADDNTVNSIKSYASAFSSLVSSLDKYDTKMKEWTKEGKSITLPMIDTESVTKAGENIDLLAEKSEKLAQSMQNIKSGLTDVKDLNKFVQNFNKAYDNNQSKQVANAAAEYENNIKNFSNQLGVDKTKAWNLENKFKEGKTLSYSNDALEKNLTVYLKTLDMLEKRLQAFPERFEEIQTMYENVKNGYGKTIEEAMSLEEMFNTTDYFSGVHAVADNQEYGKVYEEKFQAIADQFKVLHEQMSNASIPLEEVKTKYEELYQATLDLQESNSKYQQSLATIVKEIDGSKLEEQVQGKLSSQTLGDKAKGALQQALNDYHAIVEKIKSGSVEIGEAAELWENAQSILSSALLDSKNNAIAEKNVTKLENLYGKIQNIIATNSKMKYTSVGRQFQDLANEIAIAKNNLPTTEETNAIIQKFEQLRALMYETGNNGKSELQKIGATISSTFRRVFAGDVTYRLLMKVREVPRVVREIDTAMTDLKRVTTETSSVYDKFLTSAIAKSKQLGATVTETIKATSSFGRLGYDLNEATTLAESALVYKNVGWLDIETATNDLVSAMKAFNITAEDSLRIVDTFNILGNKFALTSADVGTGLKQSGSALSVANNSFEESAAMLTAITEITQDASSAGNALKTLSLRIRSTKAELSEMGEDAEGAATTTAKLRKQIKGITGVDILKNDNEFKSTYEIMQGIAKVWKDLSDTEQASVLESLAGKVRANQVAALLNNWSQAEKALDESLNSSGTALKENDVYLKSAEGRLSQLKATAQDLALDVFNSDELKAFLKVATDLLNVFTKMKDVAAPTLAGLAIAGTTLKNPSEGVGMRAISLMSGKSSGSLLQSQGYVSGGNFNFKKLDIEMSRYLAQNAANGITKGSEEYNNYLKSLIGNINGLNEAQQKQVLTTYQAISAGEKQILTMERLGVPTVGQTIKTYALGAAQTALNAVVGMGIGLIVQFAFVSITELIQAEEKARQATLDSADALKQELDSIEDYKEKITELKNSLDDNNLSQKEAYEKRKELLAVQDEIVDKYGIEKNQIDLLNGSLETNIALLEQRGQEEIRTSYNSNRDQIDKAKDYMSTKQFRYLDTYTGGLQDNPEVQRILQKYAFDLDTIIAGELTTNSKTLYEYYNDLNSVIKELSNNPELMDNEDVGLFIKYLSKETNKINNDKFKEYKRILEENGLGGILTDREYSSLYESLQEDISTYQKAIEENDSETVKEVVEKVRRTKGINQYTLDNEQNFAIKEIFEDLFNEILGDDKQNVKYTMSEEDQNRFRELFGQYNDTELKLKTQEIHFQALDEYAEQAGISVEDLIDVLVELGIVEEDLSVKTEKARPFKAIIEDVEEAQKALTAYDNAIVKMQSPDSSTAFLTADEVNTLLTYDDTLVESVKKTAKGYEISAAELSASRKKYFDKQREDIQANIDSTQEKIEAYEKTLKELEAKQTAGSNDPDLGTKITNTKNNIAEQQKELAAYRLTLTEMKPVLIDFRESVNTITSRAESLGQSVADMKTQQEEFNHITDKTALSFISNNENWEDFIELQEDGHYHLKETTDDFEALVTESIGYNNVMTRLKNQEQDLGTHSQELQNQLMALAKSGKTGGEEFKALQDELATTQTDLADTGKQVKTLEDLINALMKAFSSSKAVTDFNNQIKNLKYQLDMGEITQAQYNEGYDQYLEELRKNATDEDKDTLRNAEVTARQQKIAQATSEFEKAQKRIDTAYEQGNISLEQKIAQRRALAEQYYGASSEFGNTEESKEKYQDLLNEIYNMEVDSAQKSYDERKKLVERNTEDHIISIDQEIEELKKLNEEYYNPSTGKLGKTRNALDSKIYEENLREIQGKIKEAYDYWTKEDERAKNMGMMTAHEYWDNQLKLADKYYKDVPQFADEYRDIQDAYNTTGQQEMYEEDLRLADNAHSLKLTNEKQYWGQRRALAEQYYKNNKAFEKEWIAEDIAYRTEGMRAMYEEDVRLSENAYKRGEISLSAHIQNQINSWKVYYKDKAELREEDLAAQESIRDQYKNGVQEQINALEALKGQQTQQLNDEIDLLEESKAEYERVAQEKEKAIDKEIRALQRQKDAIEKKKKVEEEDYELQKAMMNLYKASMSTRLVYTGGGWELRRDEQKYQDAIKDVDEKKKENQTKQLDTAIQALQDQKTAISDSTQDIVDQIDKDIVERQLAIKSLEAPFDNLIKILTAVMAQMSIENIDAAFLMQIMNSPAGKDAMEQYSQTMAWITGQNKKYAKIGNKSVSEYYSYYPNQKGYNFNTQGEYYTDKDGNRVLVNGKLQGNVSSSNYAVYAQATREALKVAQDSNTSANTKELLNNFIIDLQKDNMTNEEFMKWMDTLAADSNMTTEDWMKKFGLYDLMPDVSSGAIQNAQKGLQTVMSLFGSNEKQEETTEEQPKDVLTTTQGIYSDTSNILKIISDFNKANPNLFVGTEGSKVSTTTDVKGNAGKIADTINNSPVFNINVTGNADKSIVSTMRKELTNAFNEYTDMLTGALGIAHQRQLTT